MRQNKMKYAIAFILFLFMSSIRCEQVEDVVPCYKCIIVTVTDYCAIEGSIDNIEIVEDSLKCDWTKNEIMQYENKNSFMIEEKCFTRVQICDCILF